MKTIAQKIYDKINVESEFGVRHEADNICAEFENQVDKIENIGISTNVEFSDGSALSYDDYSIAIAG